MTRCERVMESSLIFFVPPRHPTEMLRICEIIQNVRNSFQVFDYFYEALRAGHERSSVDA